LNSANYHYRRLGILWAENLAANVINVGFLFYGSKNVLMKNPSMQARRNKDKTKVAYLFSMCEKRPSHTSSSTICPLCNLSVPGPLPMPPKPRQWYRKSQQSLCFQSRLNPNSSRRASPQSRSTEIANTHQSTQVVLNETVYRGPGSNFSPVGR
jgi:hypothetical protein